jgi:hypothetical protein
MTLNYNGIHHRYMGALLERNFPLVVSKVIADRAMFLMQHTLDATHKLDATRMRCESMPRHDNMRPAAALYDAARCYDYSEQRAVELIVTFLYAHQNINAAKPRRNP